MAKTSKQQLNAPSSTMPLAGSTGGNGKFSATAGNGQSSNTVVSNEATGKASNNSISTVMNSKSSDILNSVLSKEGDSIGLELQGAEQQVVTDAVNLDAGHTKVGETAVEVNTAKANTTAKSGWSNNQQRPSFVSMFKNNRSAHSMYKLEFVDTGTEFLDFGEEVIDSVEATFGICLLGFVVGGRPPTAALIDLVKRWGQNTRFQTHESGWITFTFPNEELKQRVLSGGSHIVYGYHLFLKEMPRYFRFSEAEMKSLPSWVRIHGIPPSCWNTYILSRIASKVGTPVHMDMLTFDRKRVKYARVLVELDSSLPRVDSLSIGLPIGKVDLTFEYECDMEHCSYCHKLGHKSEACLLSPNGTTTVTVNDSGINDNRGRSKSVVWRRQGSRGRSKISHAKRRAPSRPRKVTTITNGSTDTQVQTVLTTNHIR